MMKFLEKGDHVRYVNRADKNHKNQVWKVCTIINVYKPIYEIELVSGLCVYRGKIQKPGFRKFTRIEQLRKIPEGE